MRPSFDLSNLSNTQTARASVDRSPDIGRRSKESKLQHIMDKAELDLQKANNVAIASKLRSHKSFKKLKLKKPKNEDIFFGQEIQAESERMLNILQLNKLKQRESIFATTGLFGSLS